MRTLKDIILASKEQLKATIFKLAETVHLNRRYPIKSMRVGPGRLEISTQIFVTELHWLDGLTESHNKTHLA